MTYNAKVGMRKPKTLIPELRIRYRNAADYEQGRYGITLHSVIEPEDWQHVLNWSSST